jgi:hypothetical protein
MALPMSKQHMTLGTQWLYKDGTIHAAYDYPTDIFTPVYAVRAGRILRVVNNVPNMDKDEDGKSHDPLNFVLLGITYKNAPATVVYLHVSPVPHSPVREGDHVRAGDLIALSGHNGHSTGPHLHVSVLKGHHRLGPFDYLHGLKNNSKPPKDGLASNNLTIYPPRLVYGQEKPGRLDGGEVVVAELKHGTKDSVSVRRLQHVLNGIPRKGGRHLDITGDYRAATRDEVIKWQVHVRGHKAGSAQADGDVHRRQAEVLFRSSPGGSRSAGSSPYTLI